MKLRYMLPALAVIFIGSVWAGASLEKLDTSPPPSPTIVMPHLAPTLTPSAVTPSTKEPETTQSTQTTPSTSAKLKYDSSYIPPLNITPIPDYTVSVDPNPYYTCKTYNVGDSSYTREVCGYAGLPSQPVCSPIMMYGQNTGLYECNY